MPEPIIQVKLKATDRLAPARERIAYRMFAEGIADISPNAIIVAKDEEEESEIRLTIGALIEMKRRTPHGKAFIYAEKFDAAEQQLKKILEEEFFVDHPSMLSAYQDVICAWVHRNHPELNLSDETIKRRLRSIRAKGGLETDGSGRYFLKAKKEQITA